MRQFEKLQNAPIFIIGEVLFDSFPDGTNILGGAPFNVAWHLQGFSEQPLFISGIGKDLTGNSVRNAMQEWRMNTKGIFIDPAHPTGQVQVNIIEGEYAEQIYYTILPDQAYDYISEEFILPLLKPFSTNHILYHGSLIARNSKIFNLLTKLSQNKKRKIFLDVNLRAPWWEINKIKKLINQSSILKLNSSELALIMQEPFNEKKTETLAEKFFSNHNLELLLVTMGEKGVIGLSKDQSIVINSFPVNNFVDSVGAGDAFSSVIILGLTKNWSLNTSIENAAQFASFICSQRGATLNNQIIYNNFLTQWDNKQL